MLVKSPTVAILYFAIVILGVNCAIAAGNGLNTVTNLPTRSPRVHDLIDIRIIGERVLGSTQRVESTYIIDPGKIYELETARLNDDNATLSDDTKGPLVTYLFIPGTKYNGSYVIIAMQATDFMKNMNIDNQFVMFTNPIGNRVWVKATAVTTISDTHDSDNPSVKSSLGLGADTQMITDDAETAKNKINAVRQMLRQDQDNRTPVGFFTQSSRRNRPRVGRSDLMSATIPQ